MAKAAIISMVILVFFLTCSKIYDFVEGIGVVNCERLNEGLAKMTSDSVADEVNKLTVDLLPVSTEEDPRGQEKNLDELIGRFDQSTAIGNYGAGRLVRDDGAPRAGYSDTGRQGDGMCAGS